MPEDLRQKIVEAIAASGDEHHKQLLLLLMRVEEIFIEKVDELAEQMTVPATTHAEDHGWIKSQREAVGFGKSVLAKVFVSVLEKAAWFALGALALKHL